MKRVAIYVRVSTKDQTCQNQLEDLGRAFASRPDWEVVATYRDDGISGSKGRDQRQGLDAMMKDATRRHFDVVAIWSVDRLGRSLAHLVEVCSELKSLGIGLYSHTQAIDTSTPAGQALFGMLGVFAEFERAIIVERVNSGMARARAAGKRIGRPGVSQAKRAALVQALAGGMTPNRAAAHVGVGRTLAHQVRAELVARA